MEKLFIPMAFIAASSMTACTTEQIYNSGQAWQQNQCDRHQNKADYDRCKGSAAPNYDTYKREVESGK